MNKAILVAGLAYGDEGKGAAVDYLVRKHNSSLVVRYNGGAQAGHNVVLPDGKHHTFSQFGAGTLAGAKTYLSRFMMVNPISMTIEASYLDKIGVKPFDMITVDHKCLITTPFDKALNIIREQTRGNKAHGSCGLGIGETQNYFNIYGDEALFAGDLEDKAVCKLKLRLKQVRASALGVSGIEAINIDDIATNYYDLAQIAYVCKYPAHVLINWNSGSTPVIFEGAQGVLLDERDEFAPHNTWSKTTFENADTLLGEMKFNGEVTRIGCVRSYMTRHGAGPFNDDKKLDTLPEPHNSDECFQGKFRRGHFDKAAVNMALDVCGGVDEIHMSHIDYHSKIYPDFSESVYISNLERLLETPITVLGYGPTFQDRRERAKTFVARRRSAEISDGVSLSVKE